MTYKQARETIFAHLATLHGWKVHTNAERAPWTPLKEPYAVLPSGSRVTFKAQAVYLNTHSLFLDIRTLSPSQFVEIVLKAEWSRG